MMEGTALGTSACGQTTMVNVYANVGVAEGAPERARERAARLAVEGAFGVNVSVRFRRSWFRYWLIRRRTISARGAQLIIITLLRSRCGRRGVFVAVLEERFDGVASSGFVFGPA